MTAPPHVLRFADMFGLSADQVRWCQRCDTVAFAVDAWQRARLDDAGFRDGHCPRCT